MMIYYAEMNVDQLRLVCRLARMRNIDIDPCIRSLNRPATIAICVDAAAFKIVHSFVHSNSYQVSVEKFIKHILNHRVPELKYKGTSGEFKKFIYGNRTLTIKTDVLKQIFNQLVGITPIRLKTKGGFIVDCCCQEMCNCLASIARGSGYQVTSFPLKACDTETEPVDYFFMFKQDGGFMTYYGSAKAYDKSYWQNMSIKGALKILKEPLLQCEFQSVYVKPFESVQIGSILLSLDQALDLYEQATP